MAGAGLALLLLAGERASAQPANDDCSAATVIGGLPFTDSEDTSTATTAGSDPVRSCLGLQGTASVWYSFTAAVSGTIQIDTTGSAYSTFVSVYTGSCGSTTEIYCDNSGAGVRSLDVMAGTAYLIEITDYYSSGGTLDLTVSAVPPSSNDECSMAKAVGTLPYTDAIDTRGASTAGSDPVHSCTGVQNTKSVWYSYTAPADGFVGVASSPYFGSSYYTTLAAYRGTCGALTEVACFPYYYYYYPLPVRVRAGETLLFEVTDYYSGGGGSLTFYAELGHDSVVKALKPKKITIPAGKPSVTKKIPVIVTNADLSDPAPGHTITFTSYSGCGMVGAPDFDPKTMGDQTSAMVAAGKSQAATVTLQLLKGDFTSPSKKSPDRCVLSLCVNGPTVYDGVPNNNCTTVGIDVIDENDF